MRRTLMIAAVLGAMVAPPATADRSVPETPSAVAAGALSDATGGHLDARLEQATGAYSFIRATDGRVLVADDAARDPEKRARAFLARYGALLGMSAADRARVDDVLRLKAVDRDAVGMTHVRFTQRAGDLDVFAAEVVVHMSARGVTAVNGTFVPLEDVAAAPSITAREAGRAAVRSLGRADDLRVVESEPMVFRTGLVEGTPGRTRMAYAVEVAGRGVQQQVWIDAGDGAVLASYSLRHDAKDRCVYTPRYEPEHPDLFVVREEGQGQTFVPPVDNLYDFSGQVYDLFASAFPEEDAFDSFDNAGSKMRTVYLVNEVCPNAYWNGTTTNYCPGFDTDDVVAHEWGHAYTQHTHGLVYAYQPGALNESYSDIWGEIIDLTNGRDGLGGSNNEQPFPAGVRWIVGEDVSLNDRVHRRLGLRDMWDPERLGMPGRVSAGGFICGSTDNGGVHTNSSVPNHAFAMLVDGKTYNDRTVGSIGMTKAATIYWRAQRYYQTRATKFADHAQALEQSCGDLLGAPLRTVPTGDPSAETITTGDCDQIRAAMLATEMRDELRCVYTPLLAKDAPPPCDGALTVLSEDFEDGLAGWTVANEGVYDSWPGYQWTARGSLPQDRAGTAAFAVDPRAGRCDTHVVEDVSGRYWLESPPIAAPASSTGLLLRFDHYVETQSGADGGNVLLSVNGGEFAAIPQSAYSFNAPNTTINPLYDLGPNSNPKSGEWVWSGYDAGEVSGSWGTTIASLGGLVESGDTFVLRFDFGIDHCSGRTGWFVDDVLVYECPEAVMPKP